MKFETLAIRAGQDPDPTTGAVITPVYQTSTFLQTSLDKFGAYEYTRSGNPTRAALETALAALEGGTHGLTFASGSAATAAVLHLLKPGDHIIAGRDLYGGTYRLLESVYRPYGIDVTYADTYDLAAFQTAFKATTRMIWIESPTNPLLRICDIAAIAAETKRHNARLVVDNTFLSPYFQRPLALGADIVMHSTTKYIAGHSDIVGGAVITADADAYTGIKFYQNAAGAVPGVWDCWLTLRGLKTLAIRMREHEANALFLAQWLETQPKVTRVYYPGLPSHAQHALAKRQQTGFGAVVTIALDGQYAEVKRFCEKLKLFLLAESLGGVESLVCYPPKMSHAVLSEAERRAQGILPNLVRLSVGIENKLDLQDDLAQALA
ncbi:MAG: PLP-dependent aspartate aminotransferase family protein [bacterium]|nr:PLP-dependent aspartate aminotransferase family protein [bacterium]